MVTQQLPASALPVAARRTLERTTAVCGVATLVLVLGASMVNNYDGVPFTSESPQIVSFFRSIDDTMGAASSFATAVGLIAMLWYTLGLALLLPQHAGLAAFAIGERDHLGLAAE